jgi:hypothetical protein
MDTSKAKSIVIILLIAFNIFLLVNNLMHHDSQSVSREMLENAKTVLEQRGVTLECEIPASQGDAFRLVYITGGLDKDEIAARLLGEKYEMSDEDSILSAGTKRLEFQHDNSFIYTDDAPAPSDGQPGEKEAEDAALRFMKENGLLTGKYILDSSAENKDGSWTFEYIETYSGSLLYDNTFSITIKSGFVSCLMYMKQQIKGFSSETIERPQAYQALLAKFKGRNDVVITDIDSGYKLDRSAMEEIESLELLPVWRAKIKGVSEPIYISSHDN